MKSIVMDATSTKRTAYLINPATASVAITEVRVERGARDLRIQRGRAGHGTKATDPKLCKQLTVPEMKRNGRSAL